MATQLKDKKKYYTVAEANATLPLLRSILRDITELAQELRVRSQRLAKLEEAGQLDRAHQEEVEQVLAEFERSQERMREFLVELSNLHVELKDEVTGLVDFPAWKDGREVYLCWRLGELEVSHWHELEAGFSGRQKLPRIT